MTRRQHDIDARTIADALIEAPVITSFTRIGCAVRRRLDQWKPLDDYDLTGRVIVLTGATSGLGKAAATQLAHCGASLVLVGRTDERNRTVVEEMIETTGNPSIAQVAADMGDLSQVRNLADRILTDHDRLDVLIHNAGALTAERSETPDGTEATVASQVVGPYLLTSLMVDRLVTSAPSRVITMSSGGMYASGLTVSGLEMSPAEYNGTEQYARAKRAQVTLNEMWADRFGHEGIRFHAMHPGWADTPGVDAASADLREGDGPAAPDCRAGCRHVGVARGRRPAAGVERRFLARPAEPLDPQAAHDQANRQPRTARRAVDLGFGPCERGTTRLTATRQAPYSCSSAGYAPDSTSSR